MRLPNLMNNYANHPAVAMATAMEVYDKKTNQIDLHADGRTGTCGADGDFGSATRNALLLFQKANATAYGLAWDGICDPKTWRALLRK